jgi:hypothetical protein
LRRTDAASFLIASERHALWSNQETTMRRNVFAILALTALVLAAIAISPGLRSVANEASPVKTETRAIETLKIVPADVLGTGAHWTPLTGDSSN